MFRQLRLAFRTGIVTEPPAAEAEIARLGVTLAAEIRTRFGGSLHIGGLSGPHYDLERFGLHFVASPRHADCLLVTGPVTRNMAQALRHTYDATPDPKIVIAAGDCAIDAGIFRGSYAVVGGVSAIVPVDVTIPGCPPSPAALLAGLLDALGRSR